MPATRKGIYHNLRESKYVVSNSEITFFFSSRFYLEKYIKEYKTHRFEFMKRMEKLTGETPLNMEILADITLYKTIEKRGFFARLKGAKINWHDLHAYALRKMTEPNLQDWYETQKQK